MALRVVIHQVVDEAPRLPRRLVRCSQLHLDAGSRADLAVHKVVLLLDVALDLLGQHLLLDQQVLQLLFVHRDRLFVFVQFRDVVSADRVSYLLLGLLSGFFL